jgi:hypothetical protein
VYVDAGGTQQVHDFNGGEENGLFWTAPIPPGSVNVDVVGGTASLDLHSFKIDDYGTVGHALSGGSEIATARVSVQIRWSGVTQRLTLAEPSLPTPFTAQAAITGATMEWSAVENGTTIVGHASSSPDFALIANEKNGVFV